MQVPRLALAATTFDGLLASPTVPTKTVILLQIAKAAGTAKSLFFTFGSGSPTRSCPFKPFFESFTADLQKVLLQQSSSNGAGPASPSATRKDD